MEIKELERRLELAKEKVAKQEKKIAKKEDCLRTGKEYLGFTINEKEIEYDRKDLKEMIKLVEKYENLISYEKNNQPEEVPVIREFLERWAVNFLNWAKATREQYNEMQDEYYKVRYTRYEEVSEDYKKEFIRSYKAYVETIPAYIRDPYTNLEKLTEDEKKMKYKTLVARCKAVIGAIQDAKDLRVGLDGDLNGFIIGSNGKASIRTIGAGGYNIQCFHYRVLVNKVN